MAQPVSRWGEDSLAAERKASSKGHLTMPSATESRGLTAVRALTS